MLQTNPVDAQSLFAPCVGDFLRHAFRRFPHRIVHDDGFVRDTAVRRPQLVFFNDFRDMFAPNDTVAGGDHFDVQPRRDFQHLLHLRPVRHHDVAVIFFRLVQNDIRIFIIKQTVRRIVLTESVVREQKLFITDIRHHRIGPMHHRHLNKRQRMFADIQRIVRFNGLNLPLRRIIVHFQFAFRRRRAIHRRIDGFRHHGGQSPRMIHFNMVAHDNVDFGGIDDRGNPPHHFVRKRRFDAVDQRYFFVHNQIRVIG